MTKSTRVAKAEAAKRGADATLAELDEELASLKAGVEARTKRIEDATVRGDPDAPIRLWRKERRELEQEIEDIEDQRLAVVQYVAARERDLAREAAVIAKDDAENLADKMTCAAGQVTRGLQEVREYLGSWSSTYNDFELAEGRFRSRSKAAGERPVRVHTPARALVGEIPRWDQEIAAMLRQMERVLK